MMAKRLLIGSVVALALGVPWAYGASRFTVYLAGFGGIRTNTLLFDAAFWLMPLGAVLGVALAVAEGMPPGVELRQGVIVRYRDGTPFEHWTAALAVVVLSVTGICLGGRFSPRLVQSPEITGFPMNLHFVGAVALLAAVCYHLAHRRVTGDFVRMLPRPGDLGAFATRAASVLGRGAAPAGGRHMAGQRLAYLAACVLVALLVLSGSVKALAHLVALPPVLKAAASELHDLGTLAMLVLLAGHLLAPPTCVVHPDEPAAHA
jgi:cytochrome b subunit of formate dehydrogenase